MTKLNKILGPVMAAGAAVWSAWNLVQAVQQARVMRAVFEGALTVVFLVVAWLLFDTGKRFSDS